MRNFLYFVLITILASGCGDKSVEFNGSVKGVNNGTLLINDAENSNVYKADITQGQFVINKRPLPSSGFYKLVFSGGGKASKEQEIYLEPGSTYNINADVATIDDYPQIETTSEKQKQLSAYHNLLKEAKAAAREKVMRFDTQMRALDDDEITFNERMDRMQKLRNQQLDANVIDMVALFSAFVKQFPDTEIAPYLMLNTDYQLNAAGYYDVFKKLSESAKDTREGELLEEKLKRLVSLSAGGEAPPIEGETPEGKSIDLKSLNKKVILVDFWRALNSQSLGDHTEIATKLLPKYSAKGLGIVSVSLDSDRNKWLAYAAKSSITWPHVSDLKGDDSPNVQNWAITRIPTYYLLDGNGRIIKRCLDYYEVQTALAEYMAKH